MNNCSYDIFGIFTCNNSASTLSGIITKNTIESSDNLKIVDNNQYNVLHPIDKSEAFNPDPHIFCNKDNSVCILPGNNGLQPLMCLSHNNKTDFWNNNENANTYQNCFVLQGPERIDPVKKNT